MFPFDPNDPFSTAPLETGAIVLNLAIALGCGLTVSLLYRWSYRGTSFSATYVSSLVTLAVITAVVIMAIGTDLARLGRVLPEDTIWWPLGIRVTDWGQSRPTALLSAGPPHLAPDGTEADRLAAVLDRLREARPEDLESGRARVLLDGRPGPDERWSLGWLAPLFRRLTPGA